LQLLLLPLSRRHQLLKLMATRRHLMTGDAALSWRIAFNTIKEDIDKLAVSNFYFITSYYSMSTAASISTAQSYRRRNR